MAPKLSIDVRDASDYYHLETVVTFYGAHRRIRHPRTTVFEGSDEDWASACFSHVPQFQLVAAEFNQAVDRQDLVPDGPAKDRVHKMLWEVFDSAKGYISLQQTATEILALRSSAAARLDTNTCASATTKYVELRKQQVELLDSLLSAIGMVAQLQASTQSPDWLLSAEKVLLAASATQREVQLLDTTPTKVFLSSVSELAKDKDVQDTEDMCASVRTHVARACA